MKESTPLSAILSDLTQLARQQGLNDARWAATAGLPKETLSRLRRRETCDLATLLVLSRAAGASLQVVPAHPVDVSDDGHFPKRVDRSYESRLVGLATSREYDPQAWLALGPPFFMSGLAVMLASQKGADRDALIRLADQLHPGMSHPDVFNVWLVRSPVRPSRFLPMLRMGQRHAA